MRNVFLLICFLSLCTMMASCRTGGSVVRVIDVAEEKEIEGLDPAEMERLARIKAAEQNEANGLGLNHIIQSTPSYTVFEYLSLRPDANNPAAKDYTVGGYDVLDITVYEEQDLSRQGVRVSADGYISFPLINRVAVGGLTTSEIESIISNRLAEGQFIIDAHVSVTVSDYRSKQFMALGPVKMPGSYPLRAQERVLDAISRAGGIVSEQAGSELMIIRTENPDTANERKLVVRINLQALLDQGDQMSNLLLEDRDLLYISKAERFYIIGQVKTPGSCLYLDKNITLVEAISMAGGFTNIAARNRTRIVRVENGMEKIIEVKVDAITKAGKKGQDVRILPGDVIIVPESFF
jgi:polysaccharide export outer membrane protein